MAISQSTPTNGRPISLGPLNAEVVAISAVSGATSGTLTAPTLARVQAVLLPKGFVQSAAPVLTDNAATLAFVVPAETASELEIQDLTYTAVSNLGAGGNSITIAYVAGGTADEEEVTVVGNAISVAIDDGVSTATQVKAAIDASAAALALVSVAVTGTGGDAQDAAAAAPLAGGVTGGAAGFALMLGY